MKSENWEKVEQIFHAALGLTAEDRNAYLRRECGGDNVLFSEVSSLLNCFEENSRFLDEPVFELGLEAINGRAQKDLSGATIGCYLLEKKIGAGGMGEVYKALDTRLNRPVALKFLSPALENDNAARRRLAKEAQAVAMLEHPNICAVHGIEQSDDHHFIVMQYIEGRTLAELIEDEGACAEEFGAIARQIVTAVAVAHSHGVIHRDLKPGNIMLTGDRQIKVLDFGLAKVTAQKQFFGRDAQDEVSQFSQNGLIIGTVSYMSPEQLRGEKLDFRSDIFSVGIILYELLTGENPFRRDSQAEIIAAILSERRPSLREKSPKIPENLIGLVEKCLHRDREKRFQSAAEILVALEAAEIKGDGRHGMAKLFQKTFARFVLAAVFLLAVFALIFFYSSRQPQKTLAVLPFSFDSPQGEKEYLPDALTHTVIDKLSNLSGLKVKTASSVDRYKGKQLEPRTAGKELGADAVCIGSIVRRGDELILTTKLIRTSDGVIIDTDQQKIREANLIELEENVSARIVKTIRLNLTDDDKNKLARKDTENPEAKLLYIQGRYYLERQKTEDLINAARLFREAADLDSLYAKAWTGLADTYTQLNVPGHKGAIVPAEAARLATHAAERAIEIDDTLSEPYVSLGMIKLRYDWEWNGAEEYFRAAISRNPNFAQAHLSLSNLLIIKRRFAESAQEAEKAKEISPFIVLPYLSLARTYYFERNYAEMDRVLSESEKIFPDHERLNYFRGLRYLATDRSREAIEIFEKIYRGNKIYGAAPLALAYGRTGRKDEIPKILRDLDELAAQDSKTYISSQEKAIIHLGLGDMDKVFDYLNMACGERFPAFPFVVIDPIFDEIKKDVRFENVRRCALSPG